MPGTRLFFVGCVLIAGMLAAMLFADAFARNDIPEAVAAGHDVWQENGCTGCHTLYGQGGAYAPDLTRIFNQRGADYLRQFMVDPGAFHPDERVMPRFGLTVTETDNLLAFLEYVANHDAGEFPPRTINVNGMGGLGGATVAEADTVNADTAVERGRALFSRAPAICATCHSLEPDVVIVGPSLYGIADRAWYRVSGVGPEEYIRDSILYPSEYVVEGYTDVMQKNFAETLSSSDLDDLVAFLMTLEDETGEYDFGGD